MRPTTCCACTHTSALPVAAVAHGIGVAVGTAALPSEVVEPILHANNGSAQHPNRRTNRMRPCLRLLKTFSSRCDPRIENPDSGPGALLSLRKNEQGTQMPQGGNDWRQQQRRCQRSSKQARHCDSEYRVSSN